MFICNVCGLEFDDTHFGVCPMCQTPVVHEANSVDENQIVHTINQGKPEINRIVEIEEYTEDTDEVTESSSEHAANRKHLLSSEMFADDMPILDVYSLSVRARNCLFNSGIMTIGQLRLVKRESLSQMRAAGKKTVRQINDFLDSIVLDNNNDSIGFISNNTTYGSNVQIILNTNIEDFQLSIRTYNALTHAGINTIHDFLSRTVKEIKDIPHFGVKCYSEMAELLATYGISIGTWDNPSDFGKCREQIDNTYVLSDYMEKILSYDSFYDITEKSSIVIQSLKNEYLKNPDSNFISKLYFSTGIKAVNKDNFLFAIEILTFLGVPLVDVMRFREIGCSTVGDILQLSQIDFLCVISSFQKPSSLRGIIYKLYQSRGSLINGIIKNSLSDRLYDVLRLRANGISLNKIGDCYGLTRERIRQLESKAIKKLKLFCNLLISELSDKKDYFYFDDLKNYIENEDSILILTYLCKLDTSLLYLDFAECFLKKQSPLPKPDRLLTISNELIGEGFDIVSHMEEIDQILSDEGFEYITHDSWVIFLQENGFLLRGSYLFPRTNKSLGAIAELVVSLYFPDGIKLSQYVVQTDSPDMERLRSILREKFNCIVSDNNRALTARISERLVLRDAGKYIAPSNLRIDEESFKIIIKWIDQNESQSLYYAEIYDHFSGLLSTIANVDNKYFLHGILRYLYPDRYQYGRDYLVKIDAPEGTITSFAERLRIHILKNNIRTISLSKIKEEFHGFSDIYISMKLAESGKYILLGNNRYMLKEKLLFEHEEVVKINTILEKLFEQFNGYCSAGLLYEQIELEMPTFLQKNGLESAFEVFSVCNLILEGTFVFKRPHIFSKKALIPVEINYLSVFQYLNRNIDEIRYSKILSVFSRYRWSSVSIEFVVQYYKSSMIRVNSDLFVLPEKVAIDDSKIRIITELLLENRQDEFISFATWVNYDGFPEIGFEWNPFLLEAVCERFLKGVFKIIPYVAADIRYVRSFAVDKDSSINSYEELVVDCMKKYSITTIDEERFAYFLAIKGLSSLSVPNSLKNSNIIRYKDGYFTV